MIDNFEILKKGSSPGHYLIQFLISPILQQSQHILGNDNSVFLGYPFGKQSAKKKRFFWNKERKEKANRWVFCNKTTKLLQK